MSDQNREQRIGDAVEWYRAFERRVAREPDILQKPEMRRMWDEMRENMQQIAGVLVASRKDQQPLQGVVRLLEGLIALQRDPLVAGSSTAAPLLALFVSLVGDADLLDTETPEQFLRPLVQEITAERQRAAAASRNAEAKQWVLQQWRDRTDKSESKATFAERYESLVAQQFKTAEGRPLTVTADTIKRYWLPKGRT